MHLIIEGVDVVYTPQGDWQKTWHGLETVVPLIALDGNTTPAIFCPIIECGVKPDFEAEISNAPAELQELLNSTGFKDWKLLLADCRNGISGKVFPLHIPRKGYKVHQNRQMFDCMVKSAEQVLGQNGFEIVTAGTLGGYSQFFMSLLIKGHEEFKVGNLLNGEPDTWRRFYNLISSHNALIATARLLSLIRMVCMNTVNASVADATQSDTISVIKHTPNSEELIKPEVFAKDLTNWIAQSVRYQNALSAMKAAPMTTDMFRAFASGVFTNEGSDELSTISYNRIEAMTPLFVRGAGNTGKSVYDGLNAFTEFFTNGVGVGSDKVKLNKRVASANFGRGNDWKLEAYRVASHEDTLQSTIKRGEVLYTDKLKAIAASN